MSIKSWWDKCRKETYGGRLIWIFGQPLGTEALCGLALCLMGSSYLFWRRDPSILNDWLEIVSTYWFELGALGLASLVLFQIAVTDGPAIIQLQKLKEEERAKEAQKLVDLIEEAGRPRVICPAIEIMYTDQTGNPAKILLPTARYYGEHLADVMHALGMENGDRFELGWGFIDQYNNFLTQEQAGQMMGMDGPLYPEDLYGESAAWRQNNDA